MSLYFKTVQTFILLVAALAILWMLTSVSAMASVPEYVAQWGGEGSSPGQFNHPSGIAVDASGYVYVADQYNHRIQKFRSNGAFLKQWGKLDGNGNPASGDGLGEFNYPTGVAVDGAGNVYVIDSENSRIQEYPAGRDASWKVIGGESFSLFRPWDVDVDASGNLYVSDRYNHRIVKYNPDSKKWSDWQTGGNGGESGPFPYGVAADSNGDVFVVNRQNNDLVPPETDGSQVMKYNSSNGTLQIAWGGGGSGNGQFSIPLGITADRSDQVIYVADFGNQRIQEFTQEGGFLEAWGRGGPDPGEFDGPADIAVDTNLNVYVADYGNNRIQKFRKSSSQDHHEPIPYESPCKDPLRRSVCVPIRGWTLQGGRIHLPGGHKVSARFTGRR